MKILILLSQRMSMKKVILLLSIWFLPQSLLAECNYGFDFLRAGFETHTNAEFDTISAILLKKMQDENPNYSFASQGSLMSLKTGVWYDFMILEDKRTPYKEMYGDVMFIYRNGTEDKVEIRWYENKKRHVISKNSCTELGAPTQPNSLLD